MAHQAHVKLVCTHRQRATSHGELVPAWVSQARQRAPWETSAFASHTSSTAGLSCTKTAAGRSGAIPCTARASSTAQWRRADVRTGLHRAVSKSDVLPCEYAPSYFTTAP